MPNPQGDALWFGVWSSQRNIVRLCMRLYNPDGQMIFLGRSAAQIKMADLRNGEMHLNLQVESSNGTCGG